MKSEKITAVKYTGVKNTMDIEVSSNRHVFFGNGIATSNSHSICYAINSFRSAFCKTHYMLSFYQTYLNHAHNKPDKQEEIRELISDAKKNGIEVYPPTLDNFYRTFKKDKENNVIYFGYSNVKHVGEGEQLKIESQITIAEGQCGKPIADFNWMDLLLFFSDKIKKNAFISLISVGALNGKNNNSKQRKGKKESRK